MHMFFKLVRRNRRRNRKENGLFFGTLLVSIIAFYMILSLSHQDVMYFLREMESDAVNRLILMIPLFYGLTLVILFCLIYFAGRLQMERRSHEIGMYLMMGMERSRLFFLLLAEDISQSCVSLLLGLPAAVLLSEIISLITARVAGLGVIGHHFSFSLSAAVLTMAGFLAIRIASFLLLSLKISRREVGTLLNGEQEKVQKRFPAAVYAAGFAAGILCLGKAYEMAIRGISWNQTGMMLLTLILAFTGTMVLFFGLRAVFYVNARFGKQDRNLQRFHLRQMQEQVIRRSGAMAVSSLLITGALCCFGAGTAIIWYYGQSEQHVLDYTFSADGSGGNAEAEADRIREILNESQLDVCLERLFEIRTGNIRTEEEEKEKYSMETVMEKLDGYQDSEEGKVLKNNLQYQSSPRLIALSGYNELLEAAGLPLMELSPEEAAVYMDRTMSSEAQRKIMNQILEQRPEVKVNGRNMYLKGTVQTTDLVTDRSITLSFALIVPDQVFFREATDRYDIYLNGILRSDEVEAAGLMNVISDMNRKLDRTGLSYESYLQNMGRQLFYSAASGYLTMYLAVIFLIVSNTVLGVMFLMNQQKTGRRYRTLSRLGAGYETLCCSVQKQICWFFGLPVAVGAVNSIFGVRALFTGILSSRTRGSIQELMLASVAMILILCVVEWMYLTAVRRSSSRYLLKLMIPEREE